MDWRSNDIQRVDCPSRLFVRTDFIRFFWTSLTEFKTRSHFSNKGRSEIATGEFVGIGSD